MVQLANSKYIWLYSDTDRSVWTWMEDWAKTMAYSKGGVPYSAKQIKRVYATPDRAFSQMNKLLDRMGIMTHEGTIPLPFYSITRMEPIPEPERDFQGRFVRRYRDVQIKCTVCDQILTLAEFNTGVCPYCGAPVDDTTNTEFPLYDVESKTEAEALVDKWSFIGSDEVPMPYMIQYQLDLWDRTVGEALYQQTQIARQFPKGGRIFNVAYPQPLGTQKTWADNLTFADNSDLEPGEENRKIRFTWTFEMHAFLPPSYRRTGPVKELSVEIYNLDGSLKLIEDDNIFDKVNE